jgi:hypothetical protein
MTDTLIRIVQYRITHGETDIFLTYETGVGNQQEYHQFRLAIELNFERGACSTRISVAFDIEESERVLSRTFSHLNSLVHFSKMAIEPITGALRV